MSAAFACVLLAATPVQEGPEPSPEEAMKAYMAAAAPGPAHRELDRFAGTWDVTVKAYLQPGAPPAVSAGTQTNRWTLGGRWMNGDYAGSFLGAPFEGLWRIGYDNAAKEYVGTWTDTVSTGLLIDRGNYDADANTFTVLGTAADPMSGEESVSKSVYEFDGPDEFTVTSYGGPDPEDMSKTMELIYTRAKSAK